MVYSYSSLYIFLTCKTNAAIIRNRFLWQEVCQTDQDSRWTSVRIMGQIYDITGEDHILYLDGWLLLDLFSLTTWMDGYCWTSSP